MAFIGSNRQQRMRGIIVFLAGMMALSMDAQVTRRKMLTSFYKATTYCNAGNPDKAIETLKEIAELAPMYPDTYLRMAEIYDNAGNKESAIVMYRKYINLEMDDAKIEVSSERLRILEAELGVEHYEDEEEKQALELFAKYNVIQQAGEMDGVENKSSVQTGLQLFADTDMKSANGKSLVEKKTEEAAVKEREAQPVKDEQIAGKRKGLRQLNLSALIETRNENKREEGSVDAAKVVAENETVASELKEVSVKEQESNGDSSADEFMQTKNMVPEEDVTLDEEFLAKAYVVPIGNVLDSISSGDQCDMPLFIYPKRARLEEYGISREQVIGVQSQKVRPEDLTAILSGRWVSSECKGNGRETWIFTVSQTGNLWHVALDDDSGVYLEEDDDFVDVSWNAIKNIWAYNHAMSNQIKELQAKTVRAEIKNEILSYTFVTEHQQKPHRTVYTWSRNILEGIADFIPFGGVVSQVGNTLINYVSEKDQQKTYTTKLQFFVKAVSANILKCEYVVSERERSSDGDKEISNYSNACYLYKVDDYYHGFDFVSDGGRDAITQKRYALLKQDIEADPTKRYPLAYMYYCGAGTNKSLSKAVYHMQMLAEKENCNRAKAWLVPACYNLSMDETYSNRLIRKYFRNYAKETLAELLLNDYPYANSLQADILMSEETNTEKIVPLYKRAASLGDVYALYKLGLVYADGAIEERDASKAIQYLTMAAEKGYANAHLELALLYKRGRLIAKDYARYIEHLYSAIDCGSVEALKELSEAYYLGLGVEQNFNTANKIKNQYMKSSGEEWKEVLNVYGYNVYNTIL